MVFTKTFKFFGKKPSITLSQQIIKINYKVCKCRITITGLTRIFLQIPWPSSTRSKMMLASLKHLGLILHLNFVCCNLFLFCVLLGPYIFLTEIFITLEQYILTKPFDMYRQVMSTTNPQIHGLERDNQKKERELTKVCLPLRQLIVKIMKSQG